MPTQSAVALERCWYQVITLSETHALIPAQAGILNLSNASHVTKAVMQTHRISQHLPYKEKT